MDEIEVANAMPNRLMTQVVVAAGLMALVALSRVLIEAPNFAAAGAVALFSGFVFRNRLLAIGTPMAGMLLSDAVIGFYAPSLMAGVYASLALAVGLGAMARRVGGKRPALAVVGATLAGSVTFFVMSNLFVWLGGGYGRTFTGLIECYTLAVPFFRNTLASDALFATGLFGAYAAAVSARRTALNAGAGRADGAAA